MKIYNKLYNTPVKMYILKEIKRRPYPKNINWLRLRRSLKGEPRRCLHSALCSLATGKVKMFKYSLDVAINRTQYGQDGLISEMLSTRRLNMSVPVCYLRPVIRTSPPANLAYFLLDVIGSCSWLAFDRLRPVRSTNIHHHHLCFSYSNSIVFLRLNILSEEKSISTGSLFPTG